MAEKVKEKAADSKSPAKKTGNSSKGNKKQAAKPAAADANTSKAATAAKPAKQEKKAKAAKAAAKKPNVFQRFLSYLKNVRQEIKRTSWPGRGEVGRMSLIVIGALVFFGITIFGLDTIMTWVVGQYSLLFADYDAGSASGITIVDSLQSIYYTLAP